MTGVKKVKIVFIKGQKDGWIDVGSDGYVHILGRRSMRGRRVGGNDWTLTKLTAFEPGQSVFYGWWRIARSADGEKLIFSASNVARYELPGEVIISFDKLKKMADKFNVKPQPAD